MSANRLEEAPLTVAAFDALSRGAPDAPARFAAALNKSTDPRLLIGQAWALISAGDAKPLMRLAGAVLCNERWVNGQSALAEMRWERGEADFARDFRRALISFPADAALRNGYIALLAATGDYLGAADAAAAARYHFDVPILALIEASHAGSAGDVERMGRLLSVVPEDLPDKWPVAARHQIRIGRLERADALIGRARDAAPEDVGHWALTEIIWRALGDERAQWLSSQPNLIHALQLPFDAVTLSRLADRLRILHKSKAPPLSQSVRGGTQSKGRLFDIEDDDIQTLRRNAEAALLDYVASLPPLDSRHPLLRHRQQQFAVTGSWSVRLWGGAGFHVSHIHNAGLVSSACHIAVPALDADSREGRLELGRPPADWRLNLEPIAAIAPVPGQLVFFPSFIYHGTRPFQVGERLSVAFDAA